MINLVFFLFAMLLPWWIGFALMKPFLKHRVGYLSFSIGAGYVLGWFVTTLIMRIFDYFQRPLDIYEVVLVEFFIAIFLLSFKAKLVNAAGQSADSKPSRLVYCLSGLIILLLFYRWGLTLVDLLSKPVFPWDAWVSWSSKAKVFYYAQEISPLSRGDIPFWLFKDEGVKVAIDVRHPYFISLVQTYSAMAWGSWDDGIVGLPWLGLAVAMTLSTFGFLRYLGVGLLPALFTSYAIASLPVVDAHVSLGSYADLWVGVALFTSISLLVTSLAYKEWYLLCLAFAFLTITYLTKNTVIIFAFALLFILFWLLLGGKATISLFIVFGVFLYFFGNWIIAEIITTLDDVFASTVPRALLSYNPIFGSVWEEWIILDNWHYTFIGSFTSLLILLVYECMNRLGKFTLWQSNKVSGANFLIVFGFSVLLVMLGVTFFTSKMSSTDFTAYFNRVSLYFMPTFGLVMIGFYHKLSNGDRTNRKSMNERSNRLRY